LVTAQFQADASRRPFSIDFTMDGGALAVPSHILAGAFDLRETILEVCTARATAQRPTAVAAGRVTEEPADETTFRAGLAGYARLRRLQRSFEEEELQGRWVVVSSEAGGAALPVDAQGRQAAGFEGNRYILEIPSEDQVLKVTGTFKLDPAQPNELMDLIPAQGETMHCRYEVKGNTMRLCMAAPGAPPPTEFKTQPDQPHVTFVFRRNGSPPDDLNIRPPP
ncbi:MAG TPA: TIGR03067 domain-containing protein, partial [Planctomycetaceae bacterium]